MKQIVNIYINEKHIKHIFTSIVIFSLFLLVILWPRRFLFFFFLKDVFLLLSLNKRLLSFIQWFELKINELLVRWRVGDFSFHLCHSFTRCFFFFSYHFKTRSTILYFLSNQKPVWGFISSIFGGLNEEPFSSSSTTSSMLLLYYVYYILSNSSFNSISFHIKQNFLL